MNEITEKVDVDLTGDETVLSVKLQREHDLAFEARAGCD
jgi:hypothetical protein